MEPAFPTGQRACGGAFFDPGGNQNPCSRRTLRPPRWHRAWNDVSKTYPNGHRALERVSLTVAEGEILALLGTSGSGKTTLLKMVNALVEPSSGQVLVRGRPTAEWDPIALRRSIGYVIQEGGLMPHLSRAGERGPGGEGAGAAASRAAGPGDLPAGAGRSGSGTVRSAFPQAAQRRPAPACGGGTCPGGQQRAHPDGRAVRRARPGHPPGASDRVSPPPAATGNDGGAGHARHPRGLPPGRPPGPAPRGRAGPGRPGRRVPPQPGQRLRPRVLPGRRGRGRGMESEA